MLQLGDARPQRQSRCFPARFGAHWAYVDRKNGRGAVMPSHPELDEPLRGILGEAYALIVYQEQIMQIAQAETITASVANEHLTELGYTTRPGQAGVILDVALMP
jgi:hypothetical protein